MIYAKAFKRENDCIKETLEYHTSLLIENLELLKRIYGKEIHSLLNDDNLFVLLKLACIYHDIGKASCNFQQKIEKYCGGLSKMCSVKKEIPHNFLSVAFLPKQKDLNFNDEDYLILLYAVAFHHDRQTDFDEKNLKEAVQELSTKKGEIEDFLAHFGLSIREPLWDDYLDFLSPSSSTYKSKYKRIKRNKKYILIKGLLHRLDHSSSAHFPIETEKIDNPYEKLVNYIEVVKKGKLKDFQLKAKELTDKNVILVASTGMGKTEFAVSWLGENKAFYTLPLRVSVNAMYERFSSIFGEHQIGILHSNSNIYLIKDDIDESSFEEDIYRTNLSRQLSMPITVTTADQLFTAAFKWHGYEKIYGTLMYSKVVVDEPQSYSPETLAVVVKSLKEISSLGGRFCLMSATLPAFVSKRLKNLHEVVEIPPVLHDERKHKVELREASIVDLIPDIEKAANNGKKVLVIVNTVKRAQELYGNLKNKIGPERVKLLHSLFIQNDRDKKENDIKNPFPGVIWIATQIVEVSLDIDYDLLFTEISSIDSLVQRMGRVNRGKNRIISEDDPPNVIIAVKDQSDKYRIYDGDIVRRTFDALKDFNSKILEEPDKQKIIEIVYDTEKIKDTTYYRKFESSLNLLENGFEVETRGEAQDLFRRIANVLVIPKNVYDLNKEVIDKAIDSILHANSKEKIIAIKDLFGFTVSVPIYKLQKGFLETLFKQKSVFLLHKVNYDEDIGLTFGLESAEDYSNII